MIAVDCQKLFQLISWISVDDDYYSFIIKNIFIEQNNIQCFIKQKYSKTRTVRDQEWRDGNFVVLAVYFVVIDRLKKWWINYSQNRVCVFETKQIYLGAICPY